MRPSIAYGELVVAPSHSTTPLMLDVSIECAGVLLEYLPGDGVDMNGCGVAGSINVRGAARSTRVC